MADILKRSLAPIADEAWDEIDRQAKLALEGNLSARRVVDIDGPHGWREAAVNVGRIRQQAKRPEKGVAWGIREVLPLIELSVPFTLDSTELDAFTRGAADIDIENAVHAAVEAARFEERALYHGLERAGIRGIAASSSNKPIMLGGKVDAYQAAVEQAVMAIQERGVGGPYDLVLGSTPHRLMMSGDGRGYPLRKRIEDIIGGGTVLWSHELTGGVVVSRRGGDYVLTVGQDFSIGYAGQAGTTLKLYLVESFTFRVLEPAAAVELAMSRSAR